MSRNKQAQYRQIFAKRLERRRKLDQALNRLALKSRDGLAQLFSQAAPIAIDLGNGWIECQSFGSIHPALDSISYRPCNHRADCTALQGGISLARIKGAELL